MYWSSVQFSHSVMSISLWPHVTLTTSTGVALQYSYLENSMGQKSPVGSQRVRHSWAAEHIHRLIHNVVLISGVQQSCVCVCVCVCVIREYNGTDLVAVQLLIFKSRITNLVPNFCKQSNCFEGKISKFPLFFFPPCLVFDPEGFASWNASDR